MHSVFTLDDAGFATAHIVGNSLGGYVALQLAARGRAESVVAPAPAGGWARGDEAYKEPAGFFATMIGQMKAAAPHVDAISTAPPSATHGNGPRRRPRCEAKRRCETRSWKPPSLCDWDNRRGSSVTEPQILKGGLALALVMIA